MRQLRFWVGCTAALAAAVLSTTARASGPVEQLVQVAFHPTDPDVIVVRYENKGEGVLFSSDGGETWRLACGDFAKAQLAHDVEAADRRFQLTAMAVANDGTLLAGSFGLLWEADPEGCTWTRHAEYDGRWVTDFALHPSDPDVLFFTTGAAGKPNALVARNGDGELAEVGAAESGVQIFQLRTADSGSGMRIYQGGISGMAEVTIDGVTMETVRYVIRVSDDGGSSFEEFEAGVGVEAIGLAAVDPTDPDRIVGVRDRNNAADELLVSTDRGESFVTYHTVTDIAGVAIGRDGRVLIAEKPSDALPEGSVGLWSAPSLDEPPQKISDIETFCVGYQAATDTFFACPRKSFGRVDPDDGTFTSLVDFNTVSGFVACEGKDVAAACETQLCAAYCGFGHFAQAPVCSDYEGPYCGPCAASDDPFACASGGADAGPEPDAGEERDAGRPRDAGPASDAGTRGGGGSGGCSCAAAGASERGEQPLYLALAFALAVAWRARSRRRT